MKAEQSTAGNPKIPRNLAFARATAAPSADGADAIAAASATTGCNLLRPSHYCPHASASTPTARQPCVSVPSLTTSATAKAVSTMREGTTTMNRTSVTLTLLAIAMLLLLALLR